MAHEKFDGERCGYGDSDCPHVKTGKHRLPAAVLVPAPVPATAGGPEPRKAPGLSPELQAAFDERNLRFVAWDFLRAIRLEDDFVKHASAAATMMRVILTAGEAPETTAEKLEEAVVFGGVLNGLPPRTEKGWAIAERFFEPETIKFLRLWVPMDGWSGHPGESQETWDARWASVEGDAGDIL